MGVVRKTKEKVVIELYSDRRTCEGTLTLRGWRHPRYLLDEFYKQLDYTEYVECDDGTVVDSDNIKFMKIIEEM